MAGAAGAGDQALDRGDRVTDGASQHRWGHLVVQRQADREHQRSPGPQGLQLAGGQDAGGLPDDHVGSGKQSQVTVVVDLGQQPDPIRAASIAWGPQSSPVTASVASHGPDDLLGHVQLGADPLAGLPP